MKKIEVWMGSYIRYHSDLSEKNYSELKEMIWEQPQRTLDEFKYKRPRFYEDVLFCDSQLIERPPDESCPLSMIGTIGIKFRFIGPKWPIRKISKWKRPKKKKWMNNKRVFR